MYHKGLKVSLSLRSLGVCVPIWMSFFPLGFGYIFLSLLLLHTSPFMIYLSTVYDLASAPLYSDCSLFCLLPLPSPYRLKLSKQK